jgi:hypothetical protein
MTSSNFVGCLTGMSALTAVSMPGASSSGVRTAQIFKALPACSGGRPQVVERVGREWRVRIYQNRDVPDSGSDLIPHLQPLAVDFACLVF